MEWRVEGTQTGNRWLKRPAVDRLVVITCYLSLCAFCLGRTGDTGCFHITPWIPVVSSYQKEGRIVISTPCLVSGACMHIDERGLCLVATFLVRVQQEGSILEQILHFYLCLAVRYRHACCCEFSATACRLAML
jgi:hypothetical protein